VPVCCCFPEALAYLNPRGKVQVLQDWLVAGLHGLERLEAAGKRAQFVPAELDLLSAEVSFLQVQILPELV